MRRVPILLSLASILSVHACAKHQIAHSRLDDAQPHFTWEIRSGGDDGDAESVCGSSQPGRSCVLNASTDQGQTRATAHLYLHSTGQPTSYLGIMRSGFFGESVTRPGLGEVNVTLPAGSPSHTMTITGVVPRERGPYVLTILLEATQGGRTGAVTLAQEVRVTVR